MASARKGAYYWRKNWQQHPNAARLQDWMGFHVTLRESFNDIRETAHNATLLVQWWLEGADVKTEMLRFAAAISGDVEKFLRTLRSHGEFEDTVLFAFLKRAVPEAEAQLTALSEQHVEMDALADQITDVAARLGRTLEDTDGEDVEATNVTSVTKELHGVLLEYYDMLIEHLATEEGAIVAPWLHLTPTQWGEYQRFLTQADHGVEPAAFVDAAKKKKKAGKPVLYDRYGRAVDMTTPGCCFAGVDSCCKGSAYRRLQAQQA